ncbi:capping complex subunit for YIEGIA [Melghirimyces profundicolus]|uniref:capping complex subunit for YIEGIA n=1 Tax=Melghirimyces profundicolus TaxID=1242148 RepID=UPI003CCBA530
MKKRYWRWLRGEVPIFFAAGPDDRGKMAFLLGKTGDGMTHQLNDHLRIIVHP